MLDANKIYDRLADRLHELDKERIRYYKKVEPYRFAFWSIFVLVGSFLIARINLPSLANKFISEQNLSYFIIGYFVITFITLIAFLVVNSHYKKKFTEMFTSQVGPSLIAGLDASFKYDYEGKIPRMEVISSLLFSPFNTYECEDLVMGVIDDVPIKFAEIKMEKVKVTKDSKRYKRIFSGIFYRADLNVQFPTDIWFVSRRNEKSLKEERKTRIELDHPLAKNYKIYTDNESAVRQVLQPFILDKISSLNQKLRTTKITRGSLGFHFGNQWVHIAIPTRRKFMEPRLSKTIDHVSFIEEQTSLLNAISSLMRDLTLK